jgi:hypothetical protein
MNNDPEWVARQNYYNEYGNSHARHFKLFIIRTRRVRYEEEHLIIENYQHIPDQKGMRLQGW